MTCRGETLSGRDATIRRWRVLSEQPKQFSGVGREVHRNVERTLATNGRPDAGHFCVRLRCRRRIGAATRSFSMTTTYFSVRTCRTPFGKPQRIVADPPRLAGVHNLYGEPVSERQRRMRSKGARGPRPAAPVYGRGRCKGADIALG